jgi:hypothetical protein
MYHENSTVMGLLQSCAYFIPPGFPHQDYFFCLLSPSRLTSTISALSLPNDKQVDQYWTEGAVNINDGNDDDDGDDVVCEQFFGNENNHQFFDDDDHHQFFVLCHLALEAEMTV